MRRIREKTEVNLAIPLKGFTLADDDCFGKEYNIRTKECSICGDQLHCSIVFKKVQAKKIKELDEINRYLDLADFQSINKEKLLKIADGAEYLDLLDYVTETANVKEELADKWLKYLLDKNLFIIDENGDVTKSE